MSCSVHSSSYEYDSHGDDSEMTGSYDSEGSDSRDNIFNDPKTFPAANHPSVMTDDQIQELRPLFMIPEEYSCHLPRSDYKMYDHVVWRKQVGIGLSRAAFECGLRMPIHPFIPLILERCKIGLGQLMPNSFLHINAFIDRCIRRKADMNVNVFFNHFQLTTSSKCRGFYSIGRRISTQKWVSDTNTNTRNCHEEWFYLIGPGLDKFSRWKYVKSPKNDLPKLGTKEDEIYELLLKLGKPKSMSSRELRDEEFLLKIKVSCREAEKAEINKRLREKNAAMVAKKKKGKDPKPTESSSSMPKTPQETIPKGPSVIVKRPCHVTDDVLAICDGPISKKTKSDDVLIPDLPDSSIVVASAASVAYGKKASSLLSHAEDQDTLVRFTGSACGSQSIAHLSQALKWSSAQVTKTKLYERQVKDLEKNVNDANKRATDHLMKLSDAEKEVAELKKELKDAEDRATTLKRTLADRDKEVQSANEAKMEAQTYWYAEGLKDRLDAVKKAGLDHKLCYIEGVDTLSDDEAIDSPTDQGDDDNNDLN